MKKFTVKSIKSLEPTQGTVDGKPVVLDRWSVSSLPEGAKQSSNVKLATFCIVAMPKGKPNPVKIGDVVEYELRDVTTQTGEKVQANYYIQRFDNEAAADHEKRQRAIRLADEDVEEAARLIKLERLAAVQQKLAANLPASLTGAI